MLEKAKGAACCGHCQELVEGAGMQVCPYCHRPICVRCAARGNCSAPRRRELRLGMGARLRDVDGEGRLGLVSGWSERLTFVDLERGEKVVPFAHYDDESFFFTGRLPTLVAADGLAWLEWERHATRLRVSRRDEPAAPVELVLQDEFRFRTYAHCSTLLAQSEEGRYFAVLGVERLHLVGMPAAQYLGAIEERSQVIHAAALSAQLDLLALGLWEEIVCYRLSTRERIGGRKLEGGSIVWLGFGAGRLAALSEAGKLVVLDTAPMMAPRLWPELRSTAALGLVGAPADLSPDGRLLALRGDKRQLSILDVERGATQQLHGHTDTVNLIRFVRGGELLVSADLDNRVVLWPRAGDRLLGEERSPR